MTTPIWLRRTGRILNNNSTSILSAAAVGGVVVTAVLAVRTGKRIEVAMSNDQMRAEDAPPIPAKAYETGFSLSKAKVHISLFWRDYIPPTISGLATIGCIVGANQIGLRKQAAMLGAYTLADTAFREYKEEVVKLLGEKKNQEVQDRVAVKKIDENPPKDNQVIITGGGDQLCYDVLSGRYFKSDIETIRRAANEINKTIVGGNMYASLNEFWGFLGLAPTTLGEELGYNLEHFVDLVFTSHLAQDGTPCLAVGHASLPIADYGKVF